MISHLEHHVGLRLFLLQGGLPRRNPRAITARQPLQLRGRNAQQALRGLSDKGGKGAVGQGDAALVVEDQQTFRQRVERLAHATGDCRLSGVELLQDLLEEIRERTETGQSHEREYGSPGVPDHSQNSLIPNRLEPQFNHAIQLLTGQRQRQLDLALRGGPLIGERLPLRLMIADRHHQSVLLAEPGGQQIRIALNGFLEQFLKRIEALIAPLADLKQGGVPQGLRQRGAALERLLLRRGHNAQDQRQRQDGRDDARQRQRQAGSHTDVFEERHGGLHSSPQPCGVS